MDYQHNKGIGNITTLLKLVATESNYKIWQYRNDISFGNDVHDNKIEDRIIDMIVYIGWNNRKLRAHLARLMLN